MNEKIFLDNLIKCRAFQQNIIGLLISFLILPSLLLFHYFPLIYKILFSAILSIELLSSSLSAMKFVGKLFSLSLCQQRNSEPSLFLCSQNPSRCLSFTTTKTQKILGDELLCNCLNAIRHYFLCGPRW